METATKDSKEQRLYPKDLETAKRQVIRERKVARHVITVDYCGNLLSHIENENPQLDVVAVIGPAQIKDWFFPETILLEIGFRKARPYNKTSGIKNGTKRKQVWYRRKFASLTSFQLLNVFPKIQEILLRNTEEVMSNWEVQQFKMSYGVKGNRDGEMVRVKGVCYSVSFQDREVMATVLQSEKYLRQVELMYDLKKVAERVRRVVCSYKNQYPSKKQWINMQGSNKMLALFEHLDSKGLLPHHYFIIQEELKRSNGRMLYEKVVEEMGIDIEDVFDWGDMLEMDVFQMFSRAHVRCMPNRHQPRRFWSEELSKWSITKKEIKYLSFELIPLSMMEEGNAVDLDDIPF